jgi:CpeT protein
VANDGRHAVLGHPSGDRLPLDVAATTEVLRFVRSGEVFAVVRLTDVAPDMKVFERSGLHGVWREREGFDEQGRFVLVTSDGTRHVFDPTTGRRAGSVSDLERLVAWTTGSFRSAAKAQADAGFHAVLLHMAPIWRARDDGPWLYVEQALAATPQAPYRQRGCRPRSLGEGVFESRVYELRDPAGAVGAWKEGAPAPGAGPDALIEKPGCAVILRRLDNGSFAGSTLGSQCATEGGGAAHATSEVTITADGLRTWDRGFDAAGAQVWGSTQGPYRFERFAAAAR